VKPAPTDVKKQNAVQMDRKRTSPGQGWSWIVCWLKIPRGVSKIGLCSRNLNTQTPEKLHGTIKIEISRGRDRLWMMVRSKEDSVQ
jgi:hypothetical protein